MTSSNNGSAMEPALDRSPESSAPAIAPSHAQNFIPREPCPVPAPVPLTNDGASPVSAVPSGFRSVISTRGATPTRTSSTMNGNAARTQTDTFEKGRGWRDHAEHRAGLWSRLTSFWSCLISDWWIFELAAGFLSLAAMASIFGVLMAYDQKPVPPLASGITLNAVISSLATVSRTAIMLSVGTALSQCKWLWFTRERSLADLQSIDDASRGPLGAVLMLFKLRGGSIAYLAALATLGVLGFDPFVQQLLTTEYRVVAVPSAGVSIDSVTDMLGNTVAALQSSETEARITAAMLSEVSQDPEQVKEISAPSMIGTAFSELSHKTSTLQSDTSSLRPTCPSGNCVWPKYRTLDLCASRHDITETTTVESLSPEAPKLRDLVLAAHQNTSNGKLPVTSIWDVVPKDGNRVRFNSTIVLADQIEPDQDPIGYTGNYVRKRVWPLNFEDGGMPEPDYAGLVGSTMRLGYAEFDFDARVPLLQLKSAFDCGLTYCVKEYKRSVVAGNLVSETLSTQFGTLVNPLATDLNGMTWTAVVEGRNYTAPEWLHYGIGDLVQIALGESTYTSAGWCYKNNDWKCDDPWYVRRLDNYSSPQWEGIDLTANFALVVENAIAVYSDVAQQYGDIPVTGQNSLTKPFVVVRWPWIALPLTIILLGLATLGLTVWQTHRMQAPSWKSSLLPLIYRYDQMERDRSPQQYSGQGTASQAAQPRTLNQAIDLSTSQPVSQQQCQEPLQVADQQQQQDESKVYPRRSPSPSSGQVTSQQGDPSYRPIQFSNLVSDFATEADDTTAVISRYESAGAIWTLKSTHAAISHSHASATSGSTP